MFVESFSLTFRCSIIPKKTRRTDNDNGAASEHRYVVPILR